MAKNIAPARKPVKSKADRKLRAASTVAEFKAGIARLLFDARLAVGTRLTQLLESDRIGEIEAVVQAHMDKSGIGELPQTFDQPFFGYDNFADTMTQVVNGWMGRMLGTTTGQHYDHSLQMLRGADPDVFSFKLGDNPTWTFDKSNIPGGSAAFAAKEPFAPMLQILADVGLTFDKPTAIESILNAEDFELRELRKGIVLAFLESTGRPANPAGAELLRTGVVTMRFDADVELLDESMVIKPYILIDIDRTLYSSLVELEPNTKEEPLYIYMWMRQAVKASKSPTSSRRWKGHAVVDLRTVSRKTRVVKTKFGKIKPRVNSDNFAIGAVGMPLFVPEVDQCAEYVSSISQSTKIDEDGVYDFAGSHMSWANRIIFVDWFNDYLLYADKIGELHSHRLIGVRALDSRAEAFFMNSPLNAINNLTSIVNEAITLASRNVDEEEVEKLLSDTTRQYFSAMGEKIPNIYNASSSLMTQSIDRTGERSSNSDKATISIRHLLGSGVEEIRTGQDESMAPRFRALAEVVRTYLKLLHGRRTKLEMDVHSRINGLEYLLSAANKYKVADLDKLHADGQAATRLATSKHDFGDSIEVPNLVIGPKSIEAVMPHQYRYLSEMNQGVTASAVGIATGGGKGLTLPLDILLQMVQNKVKRPLMLTKPRLVKENITEINRISGGKINVVPLRTRNLRHMKRKAGLKTAHDLLTWLRNLPRNTIFICAYSDTATRSQIYEELDVPGRALWFDNGLSQLVHLMRLLEIDMVVGDESHLIKKLDTQRSVCSYSLFASAEHGRVASGTLINNMPRDLVGQYYALSPMLFGNNIDHFEEQFQIKGGLLTSDEASARLKFRQNEIVRTFEADEEDWGFVLPTFSDSIEHFVLTPLQEEFYNILLQEAQLEVKALLEGRGKKKAKGKKNAKTDDSEETAAAEDAAEGSDEDDDDEEPESADDYEDEDAYIIAIAQASLAKVEQFLIAPEKNEQYITWSKRPSGKDLISPIVAKFDADIAAHFARLPKERHATEKVIVFGINKVASEHYFKHSRWAAQGLRYTASDEEIVRRFKTEKDKLVLFADETSLREGENLQMCSVICRTQPVWTHGDYKQAAARAYRPDPRGQYATRDTVRHVWYIAEGANRRPTISSVKLATMIAKSVSNAKLRYAEDMSWRKVSPEFEHLRRLRMKLELLFNTKRDDVQPYLEKWGTFNGWLNTRIHTKKLQFANELERQHNIDLVKDGKILDLKKFLRLAMPPVTSKTVLPGSKRSYVPWELGATPADIYGLDLVVLGGQPARIGQPVMTEFGAAKVLNNESERSIKVELFGGKTVTLRRLSVAIPSTVAGGKKLAAIVANKKEWKSTYISPRITPNAAPVDIGKGGRDTAPADPKPRLAEPAPRKSSAIMRPVEDDREEVEIFTAIINGWPFLAIDKDQAPAALTKRGWKPANPYLAVTFRTWTQANNFLDILVDRFYLAQSKFDQLLEELETLRDGKSMRLVSRIKETEVRSFFLAQHRTKTKARDGRFIVDPYWTALDDTIYLAFDRDSHSTSVINWLKRVTAKTSGMRMGKPNSGFMLLPFKTMAEAREGIASAAELMQFDQDQLKEELDELKEDLKQFATKKVAPAPRRR